MPRVLNKRTDIIPADAVYIGRPSKWSNPFKIGTNIQKYRSYVLKNPTLLAALPELHGKDLVCWCAPAACHGDVLIKLANASRRRRSA